MQYYIRIMFGKIFKILVRLTVFFGIKQKKSSKNITIQVIENDEKESVTNQSISFVPSQEQSKDLNNNFNIADEEVRSPG